MACFLLVRGQLVHSIAALFWIVETKTGGATISISMPGERPVAERERDERKSEREHNHLHDDNGREK
jgi:hypothetical protein